jgi:PKD repeat protein
MLSAYARRAVVAFAVAAATTACTIHDANTPSLTGPSALATTLVVTASPDSISQDGGSQSSIKVTAVGPDGKGIGAVPLRVDMRVGGVAQDFGTLSARTVVTNSDGVASVVFTSPPAPSNGVFGTCNGLPGTCVSIVASATGSNFIGVNPESVQIRLVPPGVILPPPDTPTASFQFAPANVVVGQTVTFDATASQSTSGIVSYAWNFGDGTIGSGAVVTHSFANVASYTVTLTVTNARTGVASTSRSVAVSASALPTANFTTSPAAVQVGDIVSFNAASSSAPVGRTIRSYDWDFGDGTPHASGQITAHIYGAANIYTVTLTVTDDLGQQGTKSSTVSIGTGAPVASFTSNVVDATTHRMAFDASGSVAVGGATITTYQWAFGDGQFFGPSSASSATHAYAAAGTYTVRVTVTDSLNRTGTSSTQVTVP